MPPCVTRVVLPDTKARFLMPPHLSSRVHTRANFLLLLRHKFQTALRRVPAPLLLGSPSTPHLTSVCLCLTPRPWHLQLYKTSHSYLSFLSFPLSPSCQRACVHARPFSACLLLSSKKNYPGNQRRGGGGGGVPVRDSPLLQRALLSGSGCPPSPKTWMWNYEKR